LKFSIIIPTFQHLNDCLKPCCESIIKNTTLNEDIEIIIVANGCTDGTQDYIKSLGPQFKLLDFPEAIGYPKAINSGLKIALGEYIVLFNNDCTILDYWEKNKWIETLNGPFIKNKKCGITGSVMNWCSAAGAYVLTFCCVMIPRSMFDLIGDLDEAFTPGAGEDTDFCMKTIRAGFKLVRVPVGETPYIKNGQWISTFPLYHRAGITCHEIPNWNDIIERNRKILQDRYNDQFKFGNNGERAVFGKNDNINPKEKIRYEWCSRNIYGSKILELGCSYGYGLRFFKDIPNLDYTGIDYDQNIIDYAIKNFGDIPGVKFQKANVNDFKFEQYDTIIAFEFLEHIENGKELAQRLKQHCKCLLTTTPYNETPGGYGPHHKLHRLTEKDFPGFEYLYLTENNIIYKTPQDNGFSLILMKWIDDKFVKNNIKFSIIIPTFNNLETCLKPCCESIIKNTTLNESIEIIVVANGCTDGTQEYVKSLGPSFKLLDFSEPIGYPKAINTGITSSSGDYVVLLNNDCRILDYWEKDRWLKCLNEPFINNDKCGVTGTVCVHNSEIDIDFLIFFCVMISKRTINSVGLLDEIFSPGSSEDIDYCMRVKLVGLELIRVPIDDKPYIENGRWTTQFPLYHEAEATVNNLPGWSDIFKRNLEILRNKYKKTNTDVTCVILTKNRYHTTLPLTLMAIANQTVKPKHLIIYDDGEHKDLRKDPLYSHIFSIISAKGISWEVVFSNSTSWVTNHISSIQKAKTEFLWRVDDDGVPEYDVLEKLLKHVTDKTGAVGGCVIDGNGIMSPSSIASNKIEDIFLGANEQWYMYPKNSQPKIVDHLHSTFIYRKSIAEYSRELSPICHREETMLTYNMTKKGYTNIFDPSAITWHLRDNTGGNRDNSYINKTKEYASNDERVFLKKMTESGVKLNDYSFVVLEHGLGDHFAFKSVLPLYFEKYKNKTHIFFVTFPEVFKDIPDIKLASIAESKMLLKNIDNYNIYKFMANNNWNKGIAWAYKQIYQLSGEPVRGKFGSKDIIKYGSENEIIISPYSHKDDHPKSYPYWNELIAMIKPLGYKLVQIGSKNEKPLDNMDEYCFDYSLKDLQDKISKCYTWISVDNFLQHMVNTMPQIIPGIILWGLSNPELFGYHYNTNLLKSKNLLRSNQFEPWGQEFVKKNDQAFYPAKDAFFYIKDLLIKTK